MKTCKAGPAEPVEKTVLLLVGCNWCVGEFSLIGDEDDDGVPDFAEN